MNPNIFISQEPMQNDGSLGQPLLGQMFVTETHTETRTCSFMNIDVYDGFNLLSKYPCHVYHNTTIHSKYILLTSKLSTPYHLPPPTTGTFKPLPGNLGSCFSVCNLILTQLERLPQKKNGRRPQKKIKMEDDHKKNKKN